MKKYKKTEENFLGSIPSPEYNRTVSACVINGYVDVDGVVYYVENSNDTNQEVKLVLFPDGTAKVVKDEKESETK
jgi:hypothetical protein